MFACMFRPTVQCLCCVLVLACVVSIHTRFTSKTVCVDNAPCMATTANKSWTFSRVEHRTWSGLPADNIYSCRYVCISLDIYTCISLDIDMYISRYICADIYSYTCVYLDLYTCIIMRVVLHTWKANYKGTTAMNFDYKKS